MEMPKTGETAGYELQECAWEWHSSEQKQQAGARSSLTLYSGKKYWLRLVEEKFLRYAYSECCEAMKDRNWNLMWKNGELN